METRSSINRAKGEPCLGGFTHRGLLPHLHWGASESPEALPDQCCQGLAGPSRGSRAAGPGLSGWQGEDEGTGEAVHVPLPGTSLQRGQVGAIFLGKSLSTALRAWKEQQARVLSLGLEDDRTLQRVLE